LSCHRALEISGYVDGELDQAQAAAVQKHLDECEACDLGYRHYLALRSSMRNSSLYHRTPLEFKMRVRSLLQTDAEAEAANRLMLPW
jgi:anti-sigma factor RsiW